MVKYEIKYIFYFRTLFNMTHTSSDFAYFINTWTIASIYQDPRARFRHAQQPEKIKNEY